MGPRASGYGQPLTCPQSSLGRAIGSTVHELARCWDFNWGPGMLGGAPLGPSRLLLIYFTVRT